MDRNVYARAINQLQPIIAQPANATLNIESIHYVSLCDVEEASQRPENYYQEKTPHLPKQRVPCTQAPTRYPPQKHPTYPPKLPKVPPRYKQIMRFVCVPTGGHHIQPALIIMITH